MVPNKGNRVALKSWRKGGAHFCCNLPRRCGIYGPHVTRHPDIVQDEGGKS
jgi:hypothetical protein